MIRKIYGIILSGGKATRMNGKKSFRIVNNKYLIENVTNVLKNVNVPFIIVFKSINSDESSNEEIEKQKYIHNKYNQTITFDILKSENPLIGIYTGMNLINSNWVLVLPCDSPLISEKAIIKLINKIEYAEKNNYNCIVPKHSNGYVEPLFSLYNKSTIKVLEKIVYEVHNGNQLPIRAYINKLNPLYISAEELDHSKKTFLNINTIEDIKKLEK